VTLTVSNSSLKQSCSVSTSVTSALEVNFNNMRYINLHFTYLLYLLMKSTGMHIRALLREPITAVYNRVVITDITRPITVL